MSIHNVKNKQFRIIIKSRRVRKINTKKLSKRFFKYILKLLLKLKAHCLFFIYFN